METTRCGYANRNSYIVIQFKNATAATNLIRKGSIVVWGITFTVIPFRSNDELVETVRHMKFTSPLAPPAPDRSEENILSALNDDCLGEIFRRSVRLSDLMSIGSVCKRFKQIAEKSFISVYKATKSTFADLNPGGEVTLPQIETFLHRFGPLLDSVHLNDGDYRHLADGLNAILILMTKYCTNLKTLHLEFDDRRGKKIESQTLIKVRPLLSKLNRFTICHRLLSECKGLIAACAQIEKLTVEIHETDSILPEINFPNLKSCCLSAIDDGVLDGFIAQNPQIEKLEIPFESNVIRLVSTNMPNLRELNLTDLSTQFTVRHGQLLKNIKQANISIEHWDFDQIHGNSVKNVFSVENITNLSLNYSNFFDFNILIKLMKNLYNLETLEICLNPENEQFLSMDLLKKVLQYAKKLVKLEIVELTVQRICEQDYDEMLQIVKNRSDRPLKLNIVLTYGGSTVSVDAEKAKTFFFNGDPEWLTITNHYVLAEENA